MAHNEEVEDFKVKEATRRSLTLDPWTIITNKEATRTRHSLL